MIGEVVLALFTVTIVRSWMHLFSRCAEGHLCACLLQPPWSTSLTSSSERSPRWWSWLKSGNMYEGSYTSSSRPLGVFSLAILWSFTGDYSSGSYVFDAGVSWATKPKQDVDTYNHGRFRS